MASIRIDFVRLDSLEDPGGEHIATVHWPVVPRIGERFGGYCIVDIVWHEGPKRPTVMAVVLPDEAIEHITSVHWPARMSAKKRKDLRRALS